MTIQTANLGFPRIGRNREWKFALDGFFAGTLTQPDIIAIARDLQIHNWKLQAEKGIDIIPSNDFSFYDHVLDVSAMVGAIPEGYGWSEGPVFLDTYFALARGMRAHKSQDGTIRAYKPALEMSKWFDTNYHYIVPEFARDQIFSPTENKPLKAFKLAQANGFHTRPVLLGPVTFLKLGKVRDGAIASLDLLDKLLPVYVQILSELSLAGADWVQIDEPCLSQDLSEFEQQCLLRAYGAFSEAVPALSIIVANYFGPFGDNLKTALSLPVAGLHADCVRGDFELDTLLQEVPDSLTLSLGVIDGVISGEQIWIVWMLCLNH